MAFTSAVLNGSLYQIDFGHTLAGAAPPGDAFLAEAAGQPVLMAVAVARGWPARARALGALAGMQEPHLLGPLAHGAVALPSGKPGYVVLCPAPTGRSLLATLRPWTETELVEHLVKPAANILVSLEARNVTHRAIRADNLFQAAPGGIVSLGCAWSAPPACHQPHWMEPPYSAACMPCARGEGTIADDVYALGALMVMLSLGRNPVEGMAEDALSMAKLDHGSYSALVGNHRLPAGIADLARGMLADDPDHRPSPALLATPAAARARRIAARPIRRAQRPIEVGAHAASTARTFAFALQRDPKVGLSLLRNGLADRWLRRSLGDPLAASQVDDAVQLRDQQMAAGDALADAALIANAIAVLDPAAPLVWRSVALWPDGLGPALDHALHHAPDQAGALTEIVTASVVGPWAARRDRAKESSASHIELRDLGSLRRDRRGSTLSWRLCYGLNPLAPCESPLVSQIWATRMAELLPAMEQAAAGRPPPGGVLLDMQLIAFIAARRDERMHGELGQLAADLPLDGALAHVELLARMQTKLHADPLPNLCGWAVETLQPDVDRFRSRTRRTRIASEMVAMAKAGQLSLIVALLDPRTEQASDKAGCEAAETRVADLRQTMASLRMAEAGLSDQARKIAEDIAGGLAAITCLAALAWAVFA